MMIIIIFYILLVSRLFYSIQYFTKLVDWLEGRVIKSLISIRFYSHQFDSSNNIELLYNIFIGYSPPLTISIL